MSEHAVSLRASFRKRHFFREAQGTQRVASQGVLSFGYFRLDEQTKVPRPSGRARTLIYLRVRALKVVLIVTALLYPEDTPPIPKR